MDRVAPALSACLARSGCGPGITHENAETKTQNIDERVKRNVCRRSENFLSPVQKRLCPFPLWSRSDCGEFRLLSQRAAPPLPRGLSLSNSGTSYTASRS